MLKVGGSISIRFCNSTTGVTTTVGNENLFERNVEGCSFGLIDSETILKTEVAVRERILDEGLASQSPTFS